MLRPSDCSQSMDWMMDGISENTSRLQQQRACFVKAHLRPDDVILEVSDHQFFEATVLQRNPENTLYCKGMPLPWENIGQMCNFAF